MLNDLLLLSSLMVFDILGLNLNIAAWRSVKYFFSLFDVFGFGHEDAIGRPCSTSWMGL